MASSLKNLSDFSNIEIGDASPFRFGIIVSQWNVEVTGALYNGAYNLLLKQGAKEESILSVSVPGSYELPSAANIMLTHQKLDAVICIGCVIQGDTKHFDFICQAVATGITEVSIKHNKPVVFGVLTTNNLEQALDRAGGKHGNKGDEAAVTAIQMAALQKQLSGL